MLWPKILEPNEKTDERASGLAVMIWIPGFLILRRRHYVVEQATFSCEICRGAAEPGSRIEAGQPEDRERGACARSDWLLSFKLFFLVLFAPSAGSSGRGHRASCGRLPTSQRCRKRKQMRGHRYFGRSELTWHPGAEPHLRRRCGLQGRSRGLHGKIQLQHRPRTNAVTLGLLLVCVSTK